MNFLRKIFIKDYKNTKNIKVRDAHGTLASMVGIFSNLFLFAIKLFLGIISGSISVIADSINNLSDMGSSILTLVGFKLSSKPADDDHPFGHERIEYIIGMVISVIILFVGCQFLYNSILKVITPDDITINILGLCILVISIVIKLWQGLFYLKMSKIISSLSLQAASVDSRNDALSTVFVLLSSLLLYFFDINLDGIFGILISMFILYSGIGLIKETSSALIGEKIDKTFVDNIVSDILTYDYAVGVHDVVCHSYGPTKLFMSVHVEVPSNENIMLLHDQIDLIEEEMSEKYNVMLVIHMDPIDTDNEEVKILKGLVLDYFSKFEEKPLMHDFRIVKKSSKTTVLFDVAVGFDSKLDKDIVTKDIIDILSSKGDYVLNMKLEYKYV